MKRKNRIELESLEMRRLLSVSASSLFGPMTAGTKMTYQITSGGQTGTQVLTIKGPATFNGHSGIEIDGTISTAPAFGSQTFDGFDANGNAVTYGNIDSSQIGKTTSTNTPPAIGFPASMNAGTTYTENWTTNTTSPFGPSSDSTKHQVTLTSANLQPVSVPAGNFQAYVFNIVETITDSGGVEPPQSSTQWFVPGKGLVKSTNANSTVELIPNGTVVVGPPAKLAIGQQPLTAAVGKAMTPAIKVDVEDASGHLVTTSTSTITLSIFSGPVGGALTGTLSAAASGGVATFSNVSATVAGSYLIQAKSGTLTLAKTIPISVTASATASKLAYTVKPVGGTAGKALSPAVVVAVETSTNTVVTTNTSKVTLAIASGPTGGTLTGTTAVNAVLGLARFTNLIFNKVGTYTIKATDGTLASATSTSFTIVAGVAAKLIFAQQPSNAVSGKANSPAVKVDIVDAAGNIITGNTSTVTMSISSGPSGAALTGTLTAKAVAGVATFSNLILKKAGTYTLKATDGLLTNIVSKNFTIAAGAAAKLVFAQGPSNAIAGRANSPAVKVDIVDVNGNIVTGNTSTVTMSISTAPSGAVLTGTLTAKAVAGVATFSSLILKKAGSYTLKATDGLLTSIVSKSFTIAAAAAAKLVFAQQPISATVNGTLSPAVIVDVEDTFGNIVLTDASNVILSLASKPSGGILTGTLSIKAIKGVATFSNLKLSKAGTYVIKAGDGSLLAASSKNIVAK